jgi:hypothetical protein
MALRSWRLSASIALVVLDHAADLGLFRSLGDPIILAARDIAASIGE